MSVYKVKPFLGDGGSSGGSEIVDALPAQGVEGKTYLLRKTEESGVFKAHYYNLIYTEIELPYAFPLLVGEGDLATQLQQALEKKLDPSLGEGVVNFDGTETFDVMTPQEFEENFTNIDYAIVQTEEEVLALGHKTLILQDLGEVGIEDFITTEVKVSDELYLANIYCDFPNYLIGQELIRDNKVIYRRRQVQYDSSETATQIYTFTEWEEDVYGQVVGTLTDTYEYNPEVLQTLNPEDTYLIILSPEQPTPTYSYTQYVFDQGVYTEVSGASSGGKLYWYLIDPSTVRIADGVSLVDLFILSSKKFNKLSEFTQGEYLSINSAVNVPTETGSEVYTIQAFSVDNEGIHIYTDNLLYNLEIIDDINLTVIEI